MDIEIIRHSLSHILALAVKRLYGNNVKFGTGPATETGFFYDLEFPKTLPISDLPKIQKEMEKIVKENLLFKMKSMPISEAEEFFKGEEQPYKLELLSEIAKEESEKSGKEIEDIKNNYNVTTYQLGEFEDLCRGPHIKKTGEINIGGFELLKVAGAYWRANEKNKMLTRIAGLAFIDKKALKKYLALREEAKKRDHRKIGKELDLFSFHDIAPGMPFFHPKGTIVYDELKKFWLEAQKEFGYDMIMAPSMLDVSIWKKSGHWDHYKDDMYFVENIQNGRNYALRPMDCPGAITIYNNSLKSYRDLPIRYAEPGLITRNEKSGQLGGLLRVQQFVQDDAHIFIREDQVESEIKNVMKLVDKIYKPFGLEVKPFISTRPDDFMGEIKTWDKAEKALEKILKELYGKNYGFKDKDGAFYGPKIDYQLKDALDRTWQCATIQLDFQMPQKFQCSYTDKDGKEKTPVLIHRTIMGSFERFMGIIIEHFAGNFPLWLAPVQVKILSVGDNHIKYCQRLAVEFQENNIRVEVDEDNETVGSKIRKAIMEKIPYIIVIGDKEMKSSKLAVRDRETGKTREAEKKKFIEEVKKKIQNRS